MRVWKPRRPITMCENPTTRAIRLAKARTELEESGMSLEAITGLDALDTNFSTGYKKVAGNPEEAEKFVADFIAEANKFLDNMPETDKVIYEAFRRKHGLGV